MWQHQKIEIKRLTFRCVVEYASCAYNNSLFFVTTYFPSSEMEMFHVDHLGKYSIKKNSPTAQVFNSKCSLIDK